MREKHGRAAHGPNGQSKTYRIWSAMKRRCYNPNCPEYPNYGGRGIVVCDEWHKFTKFLADMGDPPEGMSLDRINNDMGYSKENCRWASRKTQNRNKRGIRAITAFGRTKSLAEWSDETGISISTLWARMFAYNWTPEKSLSHPVRVSGRWPVTEQGVQWSEPVEVPGWVRA